MSARKRMRWDAILSRIPAGVPSIGAEVGVWDGRTSALLLHDRPNLQLYMVDRWAPPAPEDSYYTSGAAMARWTKKQYRDALALAQRRVFSFHPRALWLIGDSVRMAAQIRDGTLDFVFVDGDHSFDGVTRDLTAWYPKVRRGGWIGGHDYAHPEQGEVQRAVLTFFASPKVELDGNRTWFVQVGA